MNDKGFFFRIFSNLNFSAELSMFASLAALGKQHADDRGKWKFVPQKVLFELLMPLVSRSSPENRRPLGLLFSNNPNYGCPSFQFEICIISSKYWKHMDTSYECFIQFCRLKSKKFRKLRKILSKVWKFLLWGKCLFLIANNEVFCWYYSWANSKENCSKCNLIFPKLPKLKKRP